jgi:hypothetical protein
MNTQTIQNLRQYRVVLQPPFFNNVGYGIALFDLISTFLIARILEPIILPYLQLTRAAYYLLLIPFGILVHLLVNQPTFLNNQVFSKSLNLYKIVIIIIVYKLYLESKI